MPLFTSIVNSFVQRSAAPTMCWRCGVITVNMAADSISISAPTSPIFPFLIDVSDNVTAERNNEGATVTRIGHVFSRGNRE